MTTPQPAPTARELATQFVDEADLDPQTAEAWSLAIEAAIERALGRERQIQGIATAVFVKEFTPPPKLALKSIRDRLDAALAESWETVTVPQRCGGMLTGSTLAVEVFADETRDAIVALIRDIDQYLIRTEAI